MNGDFHSYLSPKLEVRPLPQKGNYGVFAIESIAAGELISVWSGRVVNYDQLLTLPPELQAHSIQVEEELYYASIQPDEPADYVNHSCDPNSGLVGHLSLFAMRDILPGEEVCFDYATCDGSAYDEFDCQCGSPLCRGWVTGNDWRKPELWERYRGYFMPYLQRRIDRLKAEKVKAQAATVRKRAEAAKAKVGPVKELAKVR